MLNFGFGGSSFSSTGFRVLLGDTGLLGDVGRGFTPGVLGTRSLAGVVGGLVGEVGVRY